MRIALAAVALLGLASLGGCAGDEAAGPPAAPPAAAQPPMAAKPPTAAPEPTADQCGAADAQKYLGRPRTEIPVPIVPDWQRVACSTCPMTLEYMPKRLNFIYDADTGIIKQVKCG